MVIYLFQLGTAQLLHCKAHDVKPANTGVQVKDNQQSSCVEGKCVCDNPEMFYFQQDADVWTGDPKIDSLLVQDGCQLIVSNSQGQDVIVEGMLPPRCTGARF